MADLIERKKKRLLKSIVCPHCWTEFATEDVLWIAESLDFTGDYKLGESERARFLPTEFNEKGVAIDPKGLPCKDMACPRCHLRLPACMLEAPAVFLSIVGAPATGKSYFLASSTWFLRQILAGKFHLNFTDADPAMNRQLQNYETLQFQNEEDKIVKIEKTEEEGAGYDVVRLGDQNVVFPRPFLFFISPASDHPRSANVERASRTICLYDNAGESYLPVQNSDSSSLPVTRHLAKSECIFFLFDPTQDAQFRAACKKVSDDPQLELAVHTPVQQIQILGEMIKRIRQHRNMSATERFHKPLIVVVGKFDVWNRLIPDVNLREPYSRLEHQGESCYVLRTDYVKKMSAQVRALLLERIPNFVTTAESFAEEVVYIPTSATGVSPTYDEKNGVLGFRPKDMKPIWITIPMLYALSRTTKGVVFGYSNDKK